MSYDQSIGDNHRRIAWYKEHFTGFDVIVELGVATGYTSKVLIECARKKVYGVDFSPDLDVEHLYSYASERGIEYEFINKGTENTNPIECDVLYIDADHTEEAAYSDLTRFAPKTKTYIGLHDTSPALRNMGFGVDLAIIRFLKENPQWEIFYEDTKTCGLTVLKRV